jgi:3-deoxy-D-manno-octulosonate 8-phosphate phosphatase (KDO 8-P phosphatase)
MPSPPASRIRVLFLDVDGTMTDGVIGWDTRGDQRNFFVRDGIALDWAREAGLLPVVISGRDSVAVKGRMADLKLEHYLGIKDKVAVAEDVRAREEVLWSACAAVGDDLPDVPLLKRVGWPIAVADAVTQVRAVAKTTTVHEAGRGAVREVVEMLLRHNGAWDDVLKKYEAI